MKVGVPSPFTGHKHRRAALTVTNTTGGAEMEIVIDTNPIGGPLPAVFPAVASGGSGGQAQVHLTYARAHGGAGKR